MTKPNSKTNGILENRNTQILVLVIVASSVRALFMGLFYNTFYWISIWSDSATYNQWARRIVTTNDWVGPDPFFMTPLYSYFLAIVYSIFGESLFAARLLQALAGVVTVLVVYLIGERLFSRKAGFAAGLITSVYGPFILSNNLILVETVKVFFLSLSVLFLLIAAERRTMWWWLVSGLALGLSSLCRPTDLLMVAVAVGWIVLYHQWPAKEKLLRSAAVLIGVVLVVAPVTIRNYTVSGELIFITSNGGLNFYLGNNAHAVGVYYNVDQLDLANDPDGRVYAETVLNRSLQHSEVSSYYFGKAVEFISSEPVRFLNLLFRKLLLLFHHKEISQLGYNYHFIGATSIPLLSYVPSFLIVGPLGVLGCYVSWKRRKALFLLYGSLAAQGAAVIFFFVTDRFRLSVMPFLILFAGEAVAYLFGLWKNKRLKELVIAGAVLTLALLLSTVLNYDIPDEFSTEYEYVGLMYFEAKQYENAMRAFKESLRYRDSFHIHNNIGNAHLATGNIPAALAEYEAGYARNPRQAISHFSKGTAYVSRRDWESALKAFQQAIEINPRFAAGHLNKGLTLYIMGRYPEALLSLERYTELERDASKLTTVYKDIENLKTLIKHQGTAQQSTSDRRSHE